MNAASWMELQALAALAETATLEGAAKRLALDPTTVGRRLAAVETRMKVKLFDRIGRKLRATPALTACLGDLTAMRDAAERMAVKLRGAHSELAGSVRVTAVHFVIDRLLASRLGALRSDHPRLTLELLASDENLSLENRETDIALRLARPIDTIGVASRLATLTFHIYGPRGADRPPIAWAAYEQSLAHLPEMRWLTRQGHAEQIALRSNRISVLREAARSGLGAVLPTLDGDSDRQLMRLSDEVAAERELWMLVHPERRRAPAVEAVMTWIRDQVAALT